MNKIFGYLLICAGVLMLFFSLIGMYKVFVDRQQVVQVVKISDMQINTQYGPMQLPMKDAGTLINLGLFAMLMMFVLSAGHKLASVGCNMLKNERIYDALLQLKSKDAPQQEALKKL